MAEIVPIILAGGAGTRLWPTSRRALPKSFMEVAGKPLLQHALQRAAPLGKEVMIVTNQEHYFLTEALLGKIPDPPQVSYLLEPKGRNSAPAIALAVRAVQQTRGGHAVCLVLTTDHLINDTTAFQKAAHQAADEAMDGNLVVFGIRPTHPETGYGYVEVADKKTSPQVVKQFVEKPDAPTAEKYFSSGRYFWNSGMFCFTAEAMADNMARHAPDVWQASEAAFADAVTDKNVTRFVEESFVKQPDISIDYAVMEKAEKVSAVLAEFDWTDVGSWDAVAGAHEADAAGNSVVGIAPEKLHNINSTNTHIESTSHTDKVIATIGLENLVIVDTPDALLIADRKESQKVRQVVDALKAGADVELTDLPATVHRPWGTYATLKYEDGYQVKRITVAVGQKLSLQYHHKRAEHWVVTQGRALVQIGDEEFETEPGEYRYIPLGEKHRLTNIGDRELVLIEVQCGDYLGEDDIVRLVDDYGRT